MLVLFLEQTNYNTIWCFSILFYFPRPAGAGKSLQNSQNYFTLTFFTGVPPVRARTGQFAAECLRCQFAGVAPLRSALHSYRTFTTRGRYFIDRCGFDSDVLQVYPMRNYNFRFIAVFRFCLTAERIIRGGTRQGDALFPRASPLQKQSTGLFLNSPLAEGFRPEYFAVCGRRRGR